jgi:hypothetical protein
MVNWHSYNESLVRCEIMLDFDVIDGWQDELEEMNEGKEGALHPRLQHPLQAYVKSFQFVHNSSTLSREERFMRILCYNQLKHS